MEFDAAGQEVRGKVTVAQTEEAQGFQIRLTSDAEMLERLRASDAKWQTGTREEVIDQSRQAFLLDRLTQPCDPMLDMYPFKDETLSRADIEWMIIAFSHEKDEQLKGLDCINLGKADLHDIDLSGLWFIDCFRFIYANLQNAKFNSVAYISSSIGGSFLSRERVTLPGMHVWRTQLIGADFRGANLRGASFLGADLFDCDMRDTALDGADFTDAKLIGVKLCGALFDDETRFGVWALGSGKSFASLGDVHWGGVDLTSARWDTLAVLGDEEQLRQDQSDATLAAVERAYRQVARQLREQGLSATADRFAYRALMFHRRVLWRQGFWSKFASVGAQLIEMTSGYGYMVYRAIATYVVLIVAFGLVYLLMDRGLSLLEAVIISITAFHGRGFIATTFQIGSPLAVVSAVETMLGLVVEICFIASFTQRHLNR